ncbi:hypothetical protein [Kordia sp.]|uniref:hypothetical protein n=1 Tax=Kordia sp. TaxID=1965332 RepID=UPI003D2A76E3
MKKRIFTVAFVAAFLFSGALLFQVESADAQTSTDAQAQDRLGKWIKLYGGGSEPYKEECFQHYTDECLVGDTREIKVVDAGPATPVNN